MSQKGSITTADYLPYSDYQKLVQALINEKKYWWACYCILSFCTGLRFSDVCKLKWCDILNQRKVIAIAKKQVKPMLYQLVKMPLTILLPYMNEWGNRINEILF